MRAAVTIIGFIALILAVLFGLAALWWHGIPWWQSMLGAFVLMIIGAICLGSDTRD